MLQLRLKRIIERLPTYEYELFDEDEYIGFIQIRTKTSYSENVPPDMASHIYAEIDSSKRGKGFGKTMLKLGLEKAKELGLKEVICTCDKDNIASKKIIEANGGKFIEEKPLFDGSNILLKYRIKL